MKILLLDIESAPYTALVWGVRKQYLTSKNLLDSGGILCFAAAWLGSDETFFDSVQRSGEKGMLESIHGLLDEADAIITYNGKSFDVPMLNREFLKHKFLPPSPYKHIDLYQTMRSRFRFASNKLDDVLRELGFKGKHEHRGLVMWLECMQGNKKAWQEMETYNIDDVTELENLYYRVLPWIKNHPNLSVFNRQICCTHCASNKLHSRGTVKRAAGLFQQYQCQDCGNWDYHSKKLESLTEKMISAG